jgi:hypothetical protein
MSIEERWFPRRKQMNCNCSNCPARIFYVADFDPASHGMPVPSWPPPLAQRPRRPASLSLPHSPHPGLFDFALRPFDLTQDRLCSGQAQGRLGSRRREYIGADLKAQAAALARVKAWDEIQAVKNERREIDHRLAAITGHRSTERSRRSLVRALHAAANGFDPYW